jgi:hypothetical protein
VFNLSALAISFVGAVVLLGIVNLITRGTQIAANAGEDGAVVVEEIHRRQQAVGSRMISCVR